MGGPASPTVSVAQRRQLLVRRQLLGSSGRDGRTVADVLAALALLHATDPATPYLSLHARSDASIGDVDDLLYSPPRRALRHTTIRRTVFVIDGDSVPFAHGAYNPALVVRLRSQLVKWLANSSDIDESPIEFLERTEQLVLDHLDAEGPRSGTVLSKEIPGLRTQVEPQPGAAYSKPIRITTRVLELLAAEGAIARARPTGADFTSGSWTWATSDSWWPQGVGSLEPIEALGGLLDRYLAVFGPATVADMAWWTGLTKTAVRSALTRIGAVEVALADSEPGWIRGADVDEIASLGPVDADVGGLTVALLPGLDVTTMGWKQRGWYVDDSKDGGIFDRSGNAGPTVWVDGRVVGSWTQRSNGSIVLELLDDVGRSATELLGAEAERIERWLGDIRIKWRYPTPITKRLAAD